jgi:DNA polymerase-3 subunit alpha
MNKDLSAEIEQLTLILKQHQGGNCPVYIGYATAEASALLPLGKQWKVNPTDELLAGLRQEFGKQVARMCY